VKKVNKKGAAFSAAPKNQRSKFLQTKLFS
jgi:hypothetical protein